MSAVTNQDWLFGQQDAGFIDQLQDGIRGLLIDAHYGQPTESGKVKTDLSDLNRRERKTYEAMLGREALEAAIRIRDRIVNSEAHRPAPGLPLSQVLRARRDPGRRRLPRSTATSSPPTRTRC